MTSEPFLSDRAVEFDGNVIGFIRCVRGYLFCARDLDQPLNQTCFESNDAAQAFLLQSYALKQENL